VSQAPDLRVERECVRALFRQGPIASLIAIVIGAIVVAAMWDSVPHSWLWTWYALIGLNQATRIAMWRQFHREDPDGERIRVWARRYTIGMAIGGALFGSAALFMLPLATPLGQAFLMIIPSGMAAGSVSANAYHPPAMLAYLLTILTPVAGTLGFLTALHATPEYGLLAFSYAFYFIVLVGFGRNQAELIRKTIEFSHRNDDLVGELRQKTEVAESAQRNAEQASLAKSQFFAAASHDLRQPLQALGLFAASLRESKDGSGDARPIDQILSSVDALESLFDELLDISKLDAGYVKPAPSHFAAKPLFEKLATTYAPVARHNGLELSFDDAGAVLHTDPVLLERVLGNLISNALRYTTEGSVNVLCRVAGELCSIEVADTGPGIPSAEHERVFDEFYQLGNPERDRRKGLGLGLATVKRIAQLLGGRISLESEPGKGAAFAIEIRCGDAAQIVATPPPPSAADVDTLQGKVIAIVEDERDVRAGLAELLGSWRCKVIAWASVREVLGELEAADLRPDAVIADFRLRDHETGTSAITTLRARYGASLPAMVISGDTSQEIFRIAREQRLPILSKPVRAGRLRAALQSLLSDQSAATVLAAGSPASVQASIPPRYQ